ncbi:type II secretion system F family protein, partial [Halonatronum saccharophilum]
MVFIAQVFSYKARDKNGALSEGLMEASSIEGVKAKLKEKGYYIIAIKESKSEKSSSIKNLIEKTRGVSTQDLVLFCRQFSTMVSSGLSLVRTLEILGEQTVNSKLKEAINSVADNVESGQSFSQALEEHTDIFPSLFISMMEAGEAGGVLDEVLEKMAIHFERDNDLKQKVTS